MSSLVRATRFGLVMQISFSGISKFNCDSYFHWLGPYLISKDHANGVTL
jgi:hypothetical protein